MYRMYIDDERDPVGKFDIVCRTHKAAIKAFKQKYKEGERHFFLELDHDSGDVNAPFINILKDIETYVQFGKMHDLDIDVHIHTGNVVGRENMRAIIRRNNYMYEVL